LARMIPSSASGRWESRWVEMASPAQTTSAQTQVVTNPAGASPSANVEPGSGGTQIQSVSGGSAGSTAAATVTSSSMNTLPEGGKFVLAGGPIQFIDGGSTSSTAGSAFTSPAMSALPVGFDVGYGDGQGLAVSTASNGTTATVSSIGIPQGAVEVGPGGAPLVITSEGSAGSTVGSTFTSPAVSALPVGFNVGYASGQGLALSTANNGAPAAVSSIGIPQGAVEVSPGGAPMVITSGGSAGSSPGSTFTSPAVSASPVGFNVGYGNGQGLVVSSPNNDTTGIGPSIGMPLGVVELGPGGAPMEIENGSAGTTAVSGVTSPAVSTFPVEFNIGTGGAQSLFLSRANSSQSATSSSSG
jgi:hypothetical protein